MPTWRFELNYSFELNSDDLDNVNYSFRPQRGGPKGDLLEERILAEVHLARNHIYHALRYHLAPPNDILQLRGALVASGTDGRMIEPSEFRSASYSFTQADVGRLIFVPAGQAGFLNARGHYKIIARNGPNSVTVDGVLPRSTTANLEFQIHEPGDVVVVLVSTA